MHILVVNVGSTSLKSKLFRFDDCGVAEFLGEANVDRIKSNSVVFKQ